MEKETHKLTVDSTARYDRGMSESATAEKELLNNYNPAVLASWAADLEKADSSAEREGIWAAIKSGVPKGVQEVKDMADDEVKRRTDEMSAKEEKARKRTWVEEDVDAFIKSLSEQEGSLIKEGKSHPKDGIDINGKKIIKEILREETNLEVIGWFKADQKKIEQLLQTKFGMKSESDQLKSTIDLLIATGKSAKTIAKYLEDNSVKDPDSDEIARAGGSREKASALKKREYFSDPKIGISEKYVERFILFEEFHADLEHEYQNTIPPNIEEIAWQVMHSYKHDNWGPNGKFPLLEMRIGYVMDEKGNIKKDENGNDRVDSKKSKYYLNQANFVRWARERMWNVYDINNDVGDFVSAIELKKNYKSLNFGEMFPSYTQYFSSEDGDTKYWLMAQELIIESVGLQTMNQMAVKYRQEMKDPKKLTEAIGEMFAGNIFTKETFRKNLFQLMSIIPLNYDGNKPGELMNNDGIFGSGMIDMFLVYYNLSDFDELQKILGHGSSFFTRDGYIQALQTVMNDKVVESSGESRPIVLNAQTQGWLEKAFDPNGQITTQGNKDNFIKLINFFGIKTNNQDAEYTVRRMLYRVTAEKYGKVLKKKKTDARGEAVIENGKEVWVDNEETLFITDPITHKQNKHIIKKYGLSSDIEGKHNDEWSLKMMWVAAKAMAQTYGGAMRNDTAAAGFDGMAKMHHGKIYRNKMLTYGRGMGNPLTVPQLGIFAMDPMNAILTDSYENVKDENGKVKMKDGKPVTRNKPWRQVMEELQQAMTVYTAELKQYERAYAEASQDEKAQKKKELENHIKNKNIKYQNKAGEITFRARAESNYTEDHLAQAHKVYELINSAEEMNMEKYIEYDLRGGVHFNRAKFQQDVQDKMITPIRYFINTYPDIDYSAKFRMLDQAATIRARKMKDKDGKINKEAGPIYREMTLGESMFGHELLNREAFWKKDKKGKPVNMRDKNGRKMKGLYEIDYDKVNKDKELLCKQYFLTKIAADLHGHRAFHSTDTRFGIDYYHNVISAIESIPGSLDSDEFNLRQKISGHYFDKKDMRWFRKVIKVENYDLYLRAIFKDLFAPGDTEQGGIGIMSMFGTFFSQIVKQAA